MKRIGTGLFALLVVVALAPAPAAAAPDPVAKDAPAGDGVVVSKEKAKAHYNEGQKLYNLGRYEDALAEFEKGYLDKPDPAFLFNLGQCYRMMHKHEEEIREYRAYLRARPDAPNRADVEKFIGLAEEDIKKRTNPTQPAGTIEPAGSGDKQPDAAQHAIATTPETPAAKSETPLYKKWWLWTAVGVVVVGAGVGVGLGVALTQNNPTIFPAVSF